MCVPYFGDFWLAPQLFRDLVVRSFCVSRFTVNKKAHFWSRCQILHTPALSAQTRCRSCRLRRSRRTLRCRHTLSSGDQLVMALGVPRAKSLLARQR